MGWHAITAALEKPDISKVTVITERWPEEIPDQPKKLDVVKIDSWTNGLGARHFEGASAVVSCLGGGPNGNNSQSSSYKRNMHIIAAMEASGVDRMVAISPATDGERKARPRWANKFMAKGASQKQARKAEAAYAKSSLDYLLVTPASSSSGGSASSDKITSNSAGGSGNNNTKEAAQFMINQAVCPTLYRTSSLVRRLSGETVETVVEDLYDFLDISDRNETNSLSLFRRSI